MVQTRIITPKVAEGFVSRQTNLGIDSYDLRDLYSPDTELWKSKVLDLGSPKYPPQVATAPTRYIFDRSRYNNHGTIVGATWVRLPSGLWGLSYDGDDSVNCGAAASLHPTDQITAMCWIKRNGTLGAIRPIIECWVSTYITAGYGLGINSTVAFAQVGNATSDYQIIQGANVVNNAYRFLAMTYNKDLGANQLTLYVDALAPVYGTYAKTMGDGGSLIIGASAALTVYLIAILNTAVSADQIANFRNRTRHFFGV